MVDREINLECDCGCGILKITVYKRKDINYPLDYSISYYLPGWYAYQNHFVESIKAIWKIITGQDYTLYEICLNEKSWQELKKFVNKND